MTYTGDQNFLISISRNYMVVYTTDKKNINPLNFQNKIGVKFRNNFFFARTTGGFGYNPKPIHYLKTMVTVN